jgi:hypothetical protein
MAVARAGDTVVVEPGVYRETLRPPAGTTWQGQPGAVIDGGWNGKELSTAEDDAAGILIKAADVTVRGLEVRNVPGNGVAVGAGGHRFLMENCRIHHTYHGGFKANPTGGTIDGITVRGCHVHDIALSGRFKETPVNGCFLFKSCRGVLVEDCLIERGHGEGIAAGSRSISVTFRRVTVRDTKHLLMYVANRARDVVVEDCVLYQRGLPEFTQRDGDVGAGLVVGDEESGSKDDNWQHSEGVTIRRCLVVNAGGMFGLRNNAKPGKGGDDGYNTNIKNLTVTRCTFVTGPLSKNGISISDNEYGAGKVGGRFEANVFIFDRTRPGGDTFRCNAPGVAFDGNAFSVMPPGLAGENVHIVAESLIAPFAPVDEFNVANYRPRAGGVVALGNIGALGPEGPEPPVEPPPPPPPPDPEPEPEPGPDWLALAEHLDAVEEQLAVASLAQSAALNEVAAIREWIAAQSGGDEPQGE